MKSNCKTTTFAALLLSAAAFSTHAQTSSDIDLDIYDRIAAKIDVITEQTQNQYTFSLDGLSAEDLAELEAALNRELEDLGVVEVDGMSVLRCEID